MIFWKAKYLSWSAVVGQAELGGREDRGFRLDAPAVLGTYLEGNTLRWRPCSRLLEGVKESKRVQVLLDPNGLRLTLKYGANGMLCYSMAAKVY